MSQNLTLRFSGLYTYPSEIEGLPPGSCEVADNIDSRAKNLAESRRGFISYTVTATPDGGAIIRTIDFYVLGVKTQICLTSLGNLYYQAAGAWVVLPGLHTGMVAPNTTNAKCRFTKLGQNLYLTTAGGILSMCSGSGSNMVHAGVQKGLDLTATNLNSATGFLNYNPVAVFTGASMTIGGNVIGGFTSLTDLSTLAVGQYVSGGQVSASKAIQDLTYTAVVQGTSGNSITVAYTAGGTAGSEVVTVTSNAISIQIQSGVSSAIQIVQALLLNPNATALVSVSVSGTYSTGQTAVGATSLTGGVNSVLTIGSTITAINALASILTTTGNLFLSSPYITGLTSVSSIIDSATDPVNATLVSGTGIYPGTYVSSIVQNDCTFTVTAASATLGSVYSNNGHNFAIQNTYVGATTLAFVGTGRNIPAASGTLTKVSGTGDATITFSAVVILYDINVSPFPFQAGTGVALIFSTPPTITISNPVPATATNTNFFTYAGSQVLYQMVFGRVETDINGNTITRLGAPSAVATLYNSWNTNTNVSVVGTIPKNCSTSLTFVQLYRSATSLSISIPPLQQFQLVYEAALVAGDFTARTITVTDTVLDVQRGASLYTGVDQEGSAQANNPPPMAWDICGFRDFALFGNCRQPSTLPFSILAVGGASGIAAADTITITANAAGVYIAGTTEVASTKHFKLYTTGTPAQNIDNTTQSLIRVINYDNSVFVHALYVLNSLGLPSIILESDYPVAGTFTATASAHATAYSPTLTSLASSINISPNGMYVSKAGENESVPAFNTYPVSDSSSPIYRISSSSSSYAYAVKTDGIYQISGYTPGTLSVTTFDQTTRIIGADTLVNLNSQIWMFSNQGITSISDSGVNGQSQLSINNIFDQLTASNLANIQVAAFGIGYESDQKYILALPSGNFTYCDVEYVFNYVTNCWTSYSRNLQFAYVNTDQDLMYICRADTTNTTISYERNNGDYTDFSDESFAATISAVSGTLLTLSSVTGIIAGDIIWQTVDLYSTITAVDPIGITVTVVDTLAFTAAAATIIPGITCTITWKQVIGDNPAMTKQFSEGLALFKNNNFYVGYISMITDFSNDGASIPIYGDTGGDRWGLFAWGEEPWDGDDYAENIRFFVTPNEQFASYLAPTLEIRQAYSDWKLQGLSITYEDESSEVGK